MTSDRPTGLRFALREWFRPPRAHGNVIHDRSVSFLELFYDLVFVVFVSQVAHPLALHPDVGHVLNFVVLFVLVWYAWVNGTLYQDLHGSDDGRSRIYMFIQMALIALLSVYAGHAPESLADGRTFAIILAALVAWLSYQWWVVRRQDDPQSAAASTPYFVGLGGIFVCVFVSIFITDAAVRVALWGIGGAIAILTPLIGAPWRRDRVQTFTVSGSLAERFGLFTIIVLGEVVVGVVIGVSDAEHGVAQAVAGVLCLGVGFGIWWNYFDFIGKRGPRPGLGPRGVWIALHLPLAMSVAAIGAGFVSIIEHAAEPHTAAGTAWLFAGSMLVLCLSLAGIMRVLPDRPAVRHTPLMLTAAGIVTVVAALFAPPPWILALVAVLVLGAVWIEAFVRHARRGLPFVEPIEHAGA